MKVAYYFEGFNETQMDKENREFLFKILRKNYQIELFDSLDLLRERLNDFDLIHDFSLNSGALIFAENKKIIKQMTSLSFPFSFSNPNIIPLVYSSFQRMIFLEQTGIIPYNVYPIFDYSKYSLNIEKDSFFLHLTPFEKDKGHKVSLLLCNEFKFPLVIAGSYKPQEIPYLNSIVIHVQLGSDKIYLKTFPNKDEEIELLKRTKCLLLPFTENEIFSTTLIKANLSGTPVLVSPFGAMKDLVENGKNGFLCMEKEEWDKAILSLDKYFFKRQDFERCRKFVLERFPIEKAIEKIKMIYERGERYE